MPRIPSVSPATGAPTPSHFIHTTDCNFVDSHGRTLLLRGVNLSGSSKAPVDRQSQVRDNFWEAAEKGGESFVGRPLNLDDGTADVHLARLRGWGYNMLRFPVTWEALEHAGPRNYDYEFMDYTIRVLRKCKEYGFKVYMDPHQDVWSRFSGGSGAPYWTILACGMNPRNFTATQAAIVHCEYPYAHEADPSALPAMIWSTNYGRLASQTLFTLFFAGRDFAPKCIIDGVNIQDYLQGHYIAAMGQMADRIRDAGDLIDECVIGWDSLNEPFEGLCGWPDLNTNPTKQGSTLKKGTYPTPAQSMRLGMGQAQTVDNWTFGAFGPTRDGMVTIDPNGLKIWLDPKEEMDGVHPVWGWKRDLMWKLGTCIWALHGVWDIETGFVMRPDYFYYLPSEEGSSTAEPVEVEFIQDYWKAHWLLFAKRIRQAQPEALVFVQPPVFAPPPKMDESELLGRCVYSPHYYDGLTLVTRHWNWFNADALGLLRGKYSSTLPAVKIGESAIRKSIQEQLGILKADTESLGPYPTIIGEIGTPFDMDGKRSYGWTDGGKHAGDYSRQERALDASLNAADGPNGLNYTVWTFCPDHSHDWGDGWNLEDLSLWSPSDVRQDQASALGLNDEGGNSRALLLNKDTKAGYTTRTAAVSTLSLATLGLGANGVLRELTADRRPGKERAAWHENPLEFLTDGARAVRAFARPWPTKVVGKPTDIKFDLHKAEFRMTVIVRAEDRVVNVEDEDEKALMATEIYVPLIHFAHPRLLSNQAWSNDDAKSVRSAVTEDDRSSIRASPISQASTPTFVNQRQPPELLQYLEEKNLIDVDYEVSSGHCQVDCGQTLKWWYEVPNSGEADRHYTIVIKRKGGVIKPKDIEGSWAESLCPSGGGCRIM